jgi:hypothetical protein
MSNSSLITASQNAAKIPQGYDFEKLGQKSARNSVNLSLKFQWQGLATVAS